MKFASVHAAFLRETACLASCAAVGAWVRLYAYAAELERGGKVPVAEHSDRFWNRVAQVTMAEVDEAIGSNLCSMSKGVLMVNGYDMKGQRAVESRRKVGKLGGRPVAIINDSTAVKPNGLTRVEPKPNPSPLLSSPLPPLPLQKKEISAETASPSSPPVLVFPCDGNPRTWDLTEARIAEWRGLYPSLDVVRCCREAYAWVTATPAKQKTAGGMPTFLVNWFNRAQNRGQAVPAKGAAPVESFARREEIARQDRVIAERAKRIFGGGR